MARFTLPRDVYHGKGSLEALKTFEGKKAIVCVGGGSMKRFGFLDRAVGYLKEAGMEVKLFEGIEPDPSVETVMKGAEVMKEFEPDWIIAMGGGSPIDAAKAMWIKYEYPDITFEDMCKVFGIPKLRQKAHFCAISSTSGTATEVTAFSIITDYEKGIKYPIADFEITPDVAIVDPELAETMPKKLVAHTGMDALTHAIEAYVSTANCDYTDALALHAIKMIQNDLIGSYNEDMEKRDSMHNAQCLAGMAFSNALLGIVHSMAHKTGAAFADYGAHIIHGAANAMYLPKVIAFNAKDETAKKRYGDIADFMHLGGSTLDEKVQLLIQEVRKMNDELNIPHCIKNYGADSYPTEQGFVPEEVFLERLPQIAANALLDACTGSNPRQPSQEEMEKLLKCCYYDTEVDF
ncbi:MAG: iron-containing alcohol dehydrogenase [Lachnospiraceae bacterium]